MHNHLTHKQNKMHTFRTQHEFAKTFLKYNLPHIINNTPPESIKDKVTIYTAYRDIYKILNKYIIKAIYAHALSLTATLARMVKNTYLIQLYALTLIYASENKQYIL